MNKFIRLMTTSTIFVIGSSAAHAQDQQVREEFTGTVSGTLSGEKLEQISETLSCFRDNYSAILAGSSVDDDLKLTMYTTPGPKRKYNKCEAAEYTIEKAEYPLARLEAAAKKIERFAKDNPALKFGFGIREAGNKIDLQVAPTDFALFTTLTSNLFQSMPFVEISQGTSYIADELAFIDGSSPAGNCTLGLNATKSTSNGTITGNVTAAHCPGTIYLDNVPSKTAPAGSPNRHFVKQSTQPNSTIKDYFADIQFVTSSDDSYGPYILYPDTSGQYYKSIEYSRSMDGISQGTRICKVGSQTQKTCGSYLGITWVNGTDSKGQTAQRYMPMFDNQNTQLGKSGDSGAAVFMEVSGSGAAGVPNIWVLGVLSAGATITSSSPKYDRLLFTPVSEFNRIGATAMSLK